MEYLMTFLEGIITFISPCLLPMLPIYLVYFAGEDSDSKSTLRNALGFVLGFTLVFTVLGAFAGLIGGFLIRFQQQVKLVAGCIVILFGLNYLGVLKFGFLNRSETKQSTVKITGFFSALLFGILFSISWTPCVGAFLGSALMLASQQGTIVEGIFLLLAYSAGLGIPFLLSAVLIDQMKSTLQWIKKHYHIIHKISGAMLVLMGVLMATGVMGYLLAAIGRNYGN